MGESKIALLENEIIRQINILTLASQKIENDNELGPDISDSLQILHSKFEEYVKLVDEKLIKVKY